MLHRQTISEKILSARSGRDASAGDIVICRVDHVIGTDASTPMAIDYFERMGGTRLFNPERVTFAFDHYAPPSPSGEAFHARVRAFVRKYGGTLLEVGEGISFQRAVESGKLLSGDLVVGADSHTVTCGALNVFAIGVGSSDLAVAMMTGEIWLKVPATIHITLAGNRAEGAGAKDVALALVKELGSTGASYRAIEFFDPLDQFAVDDRMVLCNLAVEMDAKAAIFPTDAATRRYLAVRANQYREACNADPGARYQREIVFDVSAVTPQIALPHAPDHVVPIAQAIGTPVQMVFIGTCTGGRVRDFREALEVLVRAGERIAPGVTVVLTPASREVEAILTRDGTLARFAAMGAVVTTPGCGACCGTGGVIPGDGMTVISTANRNFRGRMGNPNASIHLASPAACAAAAATGVIIDPTLLPAAY
ncbi:MAG TPA: aconitase/3-isopropylmalate dehydratase large subunit family protein [Gemmatimonadales bacterium]